MREDLDTVLRECFRSFGAIRGAHVIDGDATGVVTDLPLTFFNGIGTARFAQGDADRRVEEIIEIFRARESSLRWWVTPASTPKLGAILEAHGVRHVYDSAGMTADLSQLAPVGNARIERVLDDARMDVFADVLTTVFERPKSDAAIWTTAYGQCGYDDPSPWAHFVAYDGDTPAATASVLLCGAVAGIYLVGTLRSARGRGLG
ncbi:MAG TPA: hypothetical protein VND45_00215, partial [Thermoanaerobaculia bacterium]|nr:hypothetical protein [Thermoanaerobaculia bacterium]